MFCSKKSVSTDITDKELQTIQTLGTQVQEIKDQYNVSHLPTSQHLQYYYPQVPQVGQVQQVFQQQPYVYQTPIMQTFAQQTTQVPQQDYQPVYYHVPQTQVVYDLSQVPYLIFYQPITQPQHNNASSGTQQVVQAVQAVQPAQYTPHYTPQQSKQIIKPADKETLDMGKLQQQLEVTLYEVMMQVFRQLDPQAVYQLYPQVMPKVLNEVLTQVLPQIVDQSYLS